MAKHDDITNDNDPALDLGPRLRAEINQQISRLEARLVLLNNAERKELVKLKELVKGSRPKACLATCLALVLAMPAHAQDQNACMAYHDAQRCLRAIENFTSNCVKTRFKGDATPEQTLGCLAEAYDATGALIDNKEPRQ